MQTLRKTCSSHIEMPGENILYGSTYKPSLGERDGKQAEQQQVD